MLGRFQSSQLRIEVGASEVLLRDSLTRPTLIRQWFWPQQLAGNLPTQFYAGLTFNSYFGPIVIEHRVELVESHYLRLLLSQGIDGIHEWYWADGWVQSRLEGISLLPLHVGQILALARLRQYLSSQSSA